MKRLIYFLIIASFTALGFVSCSDDDENTIPPKLQLSSTKDKVSVTIDPSGLKASARIGYEGGAIPFVVESTSPWSAVVDRSDGDSQWCFIDKANDRLNIRVDYFVDGGENRTAEIIVTNEEELTATITVTQTGESSSVISFDVDRVVMPSRGDTISVEVITDESDVYISDIQYEAPWVKAEIIEEGGKKCVSLSAGKNFVGKTLTATVEVAASNGVTVSKASFDVIQSSGEFILEYTIPEGGAEVALPIKNRVNVTVDWGDGKVQDIVTTATNYSPVLHTYETEGVYEISITGNVEEISSVFSTSYSKKVTDYLTGIVQWGDLNIVSLLGAFQDTKIQSIPEILDGNIFENVTTAKDMFYGCTELKEIPAGILDGLVNCTDFMRIFAKCNSILEVPEGLFDNCVNAEILTNLFFMSENLTVIPKGLLDKMEKVTDGAGLFYETAITEIDKDLFKYNTQLTTITNAFSGTNIEVIPEGLLDNLTEIGTAGSLFENTQITSIPADLFKNNTKLYGVSNCFSGTGVTEIPANLFANNPELDNVGGLFARTKISKIPGNLFANNHKITRLGAFAAECTNLTEFPAELMETLTEITYVGGLLRGCTGITKIPEGLFDKCTKITDFSEAFQGTSIKEIPSGLFANAPEVTTFQKTFAGCTQLTSIPTDLFQNNLKIYSVASLFDGCVNLKGPTPYNTVDGVKYRLWERTTAAGFSSIWSYTAAFKGCEGLDDYADIPTKWK